MTFVNLFKKFQIHRFCHHTAALNGKPIYLKNRQIVKVCGEEAVPFLQGLVSNDVRHLTMNHATSVTLPCMFTLILNLQGRVLYDTLIYESPGSNAKELWIECEENVSEELAKLLKKYRVRKKIDIEISKDMFIHTSLCAPDIKELKPILVVKDPRVQNLGFRLILDNPFSNEDLSNAYKELRFKLGVGEGMEDHPIGNCFPLEINGDYLHGVSFFKGCYVGQELTSRTYHLGVVRKRLMPVTIENPSGAVPLPGTIIENEQGKNVGKLRSIANQYGIALLRIEEVLAAKELKLKDYAVKVNTSVPDWWPKKEAVIGAK